MDTFTWKDVIFNNSPIGIMLNLENLYISEDRDPKFLQYLSKKRTVIQDLIMFGRTYGVRLNSTRFKRCKGEEVEIILEPSCMVIDDGNLFYVTCL